MPGWVRAVLWGLAVWVVCYALNLSPLGLFADVLNALHAMHQTSTVHGIGH